MKFPLPDKNYILFLMFFRSKPGKFKTIIIKCNINIPVVIFLKKKSFCLPDDEICGREERDYIREFGRKRPFLICCEEDSDLVFYADEEKPLRKSDEPVKALS